MTSQAVLFAFALCSLDLTVYSQVFVNVTSDVGANVAGQAIYEGKGLSFYDIDHNGWDDLTYAESEDSIYVYFNSEQTFVRRGIAPNNGEVKMVLWADYDNDGDEDLFATRFLAVSSLYRNDGDCIFTNVSNMVGIVQNEYHQTTGASWGDFNRDGWLDLYVCNYNMNGLATNILYENLGDGTFSQVQFQTNTSNGDAATFQSIWIDADRDGDQDLYVANDKPPIDALYENTYIVSVQNDSQNYVNQENEDGNGGSVEEMMEEEVLTPFYEWGVGMPWDLYANSMGCAASDYDRDGDLDIYVTDADNFGNHLYQNEGSFNFVAAESETGSVLNTFSWGPLWIDYNNDGWEDLFVCDTYTYPQNNVNHLLTNEGGYFSDYIEYTSIPEPWNSFCAAKGDLNNDGYYDLSFTNGENEIAQVYQNMGGINNWIKLTLEGTISNRNGIGSLVEVWSSNGYNLHYTVAGGGLFAQDSQHIIMPLGTATVADSMKVTWLSGWTDVFYSIEASTNLNIVEGMTFEVSFVDPITVLCAGDLQFLQPSVSYPVNWNNGININAIPVNSAGSYWFIAENELGISDTSETIEIAFDVEPSVSEVIQNPLCFGYENGSIQLQEIPDNIISCTWSNGAQGFQLNQLSAGSYSYELISSAGCFYSGSILLQQPEMIVYNTQPINASCYGENDAKIVVANITGGTGLYQLHWSGNGSSNESNLSSDSTIIDNLNAGEFQVEIHDSLQCFASSFVTLSEPMELSAMAMETLVAGDSTFYVLFISGGTFPYSITWPDGDNWSSNWLFPGLYTIQIVDQQECSTQITIDVATDVNTIQPERSCIVMSDCLRLNGFSTNDSWKLFDVRGRLIEGDRFRSQEISKPKEAGMYFLVFDDGANIQGSFKVIVEY